MKRLRKKVLAVGNREAEERDQVWSRLKELVERGQDVGLDLVAVGEGVGLIEETGNGEDFAEGFCIDAELSQRCGVRIDAIRAAVSCGDGQGDDFARLGIEATGASGGLGVHEGLELSPDEF